MSSCEFSKKVGGNKDKLKRWQWIHIGKAKKCDTWSHKKFHSLYCRYFNVALDGSQKEKDGKWYSWVEEKTAKLQPTSDSEWRWFCKPWNLVCYLSSASYWLSDPFQKSMTVSHTYLESSWGWSFDVGHIAGYQSHSWWKVTNSLHLIILTCVIWLYSKWYLWHLIHIFRFMCV